MGYTSSWSSSLSSSLRRPNLPLNSLCPYPLVLKADIDVATISSRMSWGKSYSEPRTAMAYAAEKLSAQSEFWTAKGSQLPSSIFSRDCAVTACFLERSRTYGVNRSKSNQKSYSDNDWGVRDGYPPALQFLTNAQTSFAFVRPPRRAMPEIAKRISSPVRSDRPKR
jgi:hypothetical protein